MIVQAEHGSHGAEGINRFVSFAVLMPFCRCVRLPRGLFLSPAGLTACLPTRPAPQVLKAVVAKYNAEELLSKRESVSTRIRDELTHRAKQFHLIMDDVSITHLTFGHEFTKAIENKQVCVCMSVSCVCVTSFATSCMTSTL